MNPAARACLLVACCLACGRAPLDANLLIITLDTTRPDHLGCYGYERNTSPQIDRVAADAVVYTRAFSTSSWTLPAHASLFTGKFPWSHGARIDPNGPVSLGDAIQGDAFLSTYRASGLAPNERTLAEILAEHGFSTGAVVAGPWMKRIFGLDLGFQHYDDDGIDTVSGRKASDVTDAALAWLDRHERERFFLFLNYYDPHGPYRDPEGYGIRFLSPQDRHSTRRIKLTTSAIGALYDGEIRYTDDHVGRLVESLRRRGLYDDAWIIITSDHGELLNEHEQIGHGRTLYQQEIRIPLIVKFPADAARSGGDDAPIQLTEVFVMVLEGLGLALPSAVRGRDGLQPLFAEVYPQQKGSTGDWRVLFDGDLKLHWNSRGQHRLFDLAKDPGEESNLAPDDPQRLQAMQSALERFLAHLPPPAPRGPPQALDPETQEALRNLGYLD